MTDILGWLLMVISVVVVAAGILAGAVLSRLAGVWKTNADAAYADREGPWTPCYCAGCGCIHQDRRMVWDRDGDFRCTVCCRRRTMDRVETDA